MKLLASILITFFLYAPLVNAHAANKGSEWLPLQEQSWEAADKGDYVGAISLAKRALTLARKKVGARHPDVAKILHQLGRLSFDAKRVADAETFYRQAIAIREQAVDKTGYEDLLLSLSDLAYIYTDQKRHDEAEELYLRAIAVGDRYPSGNTTSLVRLRASLAIAYYNLGKDLEAETQFLKAIELIEEGFAMYIPRKNWGVYLQYLGEIYLARNDPARAEKSFEGSLVWLGETDAEFYGSLVGLGRARSVQGQFDRAEEPLTRAMAYIQQQGLTYDLRLAGTFGDLAYVLMQLGRHSEADEHYRRAISLAEQRHGQSHSTVADLLFLFAVVAENQASWQEAERRYQRALSVHELCCATDIEGASYLRLRIGAALFEQERFDEAAAFWEESLRRAAQSSGKDQASAIRHVARKFASMFDEAGRSENAQHFRLLAEQL